ncbi:hypothetical protein DXX93_03090 [Thalassotalea euphylliae]|uniref:Multidrug transporter n=1 Tax=Thalassotalea euphylliae TaxID=1655234 RepID=A0A3E0TM50_9GAMM|nr:SapC family protein [Thalassotalea euphylliae]REL25634.1 hypothetical protein DXX93_03090 [Thalassotalea euphylliae]
MSDFQPLKPEQHQNLKVKPVVDWEFVAKQHQLEITVTEAQQAASSFPLFFIKNSETGNTFIAAVTSFVMDTNVLVEENGQHQLAYVPLSASLRPFALGLDPENDKSVIPFVDLDSKLVSDDQGEVLFEGDKATPFFQHYNHQLEQYYNGQLATGKFVQALDELGLIQQAELEITMADGQKSTLKGLWNLNEKALNELSIEEQQSLLSQGYFAPIFAMLSSMTQLNRLIHGHIKLGEPIAGVNVNPVNGK